MPGRTVPPAPAASPPARVKADTLALSAMIVGVVAFLCGWMPVLGLIIGSVGVILGLLARRRSNRPELGLTALILSILAVLTNIVVDVIVVVLMVTQANNLPA
ncbi:MULTISPECIES: hypothetical protein [Cryobacterium]|uniref:hypothetical protein n=1 Tax=Cryobacterium TaxID=69578 RepID=UPI000CD4666A|nr:MULTISPECIES: hypothetical protein [Cryobacterium]POH70687.1 hypothetical protein C3B60_00700 [Cryobacterium zongtaii]TFC44442.1 hypothetical protein E3O57_10985 [Cryobacterium sp. TMN-39-2]TFC57980.1 hypothetical protein E3O60_13090 [Cryobacterium sp. TMB1-7]TFC90199.1 hypothetical protein E3T19_06580 [Cryobacterium sp. TMT4-31]